MTNKYNIELGRLVELFDDLQRSFNLFVSKVVKTENQVGSLNASYEQFGVYRKVIREMEEFTYLDLPKYASQSEKLLEIVPLIQSCFPTTDVAGFISEADLKRNRGILDSREYRVFYTTVRNFVLVYAQNKKANQVREIGKNTPEEIVEYEANLYQANTMNNHRKLLKAASDEVILEMVKMVASSDEDHCKLPSLQSVFEVQEHLCCGNHLLIEKLYGSYQKALIYFFEELTNAINNFHGDVFSPEYPTIGDYPKLASLHNSFMLVFKRMLEFTTANPKQE